MFNSGPQLRAVAPGFFLGRFLVVQIVGANHNSHMVLKNVDFMGFHIGFLLAIDWFLFYMYLITISNLGVWFYISIVHVETRNITSSVTS